MICSLIKGNEAFYMMHSLRPSLGCTTEDTVQHSHHSEGPEPPVRLRAVVLDRHHWHTSGSGADGAGVGGAWAGMGCWGGADTALCSAAGVERGTMGAGMGAGVVGDSSWGWPWGAGGRGGRAAGLGYMQ